MAPAALLSLLVASGGDARFLVSVAGVPSASLEVSGGDDVYRYRAVHLLEEGEVRFERAWPLTDGGVRGLVPEVLALLTPPPTGCREVFEERRGAPETLCVREQGAGRVDGTLDGVAFTARYQAGRLTAVQVGPMQFQRVEAPGGPVSPSPSPFREGFPVDGVRGTPRLEPSVPGLELASPRTWPGRTSSSRLRCLEAARRAVEADPSLTLVLGLVVEGGRAFPHAWVRRGADAFDPTLGPEDGEALATRTYLALPREAAGLVYLSLLDGRRRVVLR